MLVLKESKMTSIKCFPKNEPLPNCVTAGESLIEFYEKTDLSMTYCYAQCMTLIPLKGIEINLQMVEFWYREFIKAHWSKIIFDRQLKAVKNKTVYGRIDIADWFETEIMYNEFDLNQELKRRIESMIIRGKYLKEHPEIELSEDDKKSIELEIQQEFEFKRLNDYYGKKDNYKEERRRAWEQKFA